MKESNIIIKKTNPRESKRSPPDKTIVKAPLCLINSWARSAMYLPNDTDRSSRLLNTLTSPLSLPEPICPFCRNLKLKAVCVLYSGAHKQWQAGSVCTMGFGYDCTYLDTRHVSLSPDTCPFPFLPFFSYFLLTITIFKIISMSIFFWKKYLCLLFMCILLSQLTKHINMNTISCKLKTIIN